MKYMADMITLGIVLLVAGAALAYVIREKKKGNHCIGCSCAGTCSHAGRGGCSGCQGGCGNHTQSK